MSDLIDTTEMYLRTIYELGEEGVPPLRARIAERLGQSGPTVSQTVARMERDGLVAVHPDRHLVLSERGRQLAEQVMRKHRLAERLLVDVIGLDWRLVHEEACRWEHVISDQVERQLLRLLDNPVHSPYGNPIPGLTELGAPAAAEDFLDGVELLSLRLADGEVHEVVFARMSEAAQGDIELLGHLAALGVAERRPIQAQLRGRKIVLGEQEQVLVPVELGDQLFVVVD
ncbi:DtxR family iron (metal) dependent repressor [Propionicimonas paludicola]|uniref:DtxR family iron (Metal) dependent repressor n=1 Tax=Propionicimonas paludicola TaxID=185243 RepID=A0A2A9CSR0_9ACTN|nr:metal-dependent transcriptional regulator [Propionicimonas paludicola]PFG17477.1 DtxR family iron (metal) dependent repressor [Propionicimonas paludicola]